MSLQGVRPRRLFEIEEEYVTGMRSGSHNNLHKPKGNVMKLIALGIVNARYIFIGLFIAAAIYCGLSIGKVRTNSDLTAFLPETTETRRGLIVMEDEFITYATADIMISNVTWDMAEDLADQIRSFEHVSDVAFDDSSAHYKNAAALLTISFDGTQEDPDIVGEMDHIKELLADYDTYISSQIGYDYSAELAGEMGGVLAITAIVIVVVLLFTSRSYFEVVIFGIVFAFAALLNMGTNYWLGEISSITNSVAVILQLALAIDYAIIFSHRYQDEAAKTPSVKTAMVEALSKAIIEISSSSLTTISGLIALTMMQFRLGYDMGIVLAKGILCSLITVFFLMPGLIMLFPRQLRRTQHRNLIPNIRPWGVFLTKTKFCFVWLFLLIIPFAIYYSGKTEYAFSDKSITEIVYAPSRAAMHKITDTFDDATPIAVLVPSGYYENEKAVLARVAKIDKIKDATGLANIEIDDDHVLTDAYTPRMFAELLDLDIERAILLYQAYGLKHEEYQVFFGNVEEYRVVLLDMFEYLFEKIDQGLVTLSEDQMEQIEPLRKQLKRGTDQLRGEHYDRLVFTSTVAEEGAESTALVEEIRSIAEDYYEEGSVLVIGNITSARDLAQSYTGDSEKINLLTVTFIFVILLFTFRSVAGAAVLVFVIQGSIWINFTIPYFQGTVSSFVTNMIVSAIQMGATIDYAIVIMNRYQVLKKTEPVKDAMADAVKEGFATVITSGSILTLAGLLIGTRVSDVYVNHIGMAVGRGAAISVVLVLTVLPQIILLFDKLIDKTRIKVRLPEDLPEEPAENTAGDKRRKGKKQQTDMQAAKPKDTAPDMESNKAETENHMRTEAQKTVGAETSGQSGGPEAAAEIPEKSGSPETAATGVSQKTDDQVAAGDGA